MEIQKCGKNLTKFSIICLYVHKLMERFFHKFVIFDLKKFNIKKILAMHGGLSPSI
jgi:hypothetical protein